MRLEPLSPAEVRKLRKAHDGPWCHVCGEPARCIVGMLLDTLAQVNPDFGDTGVKKAPPPTEF